jgi:UDP-N-acetylglucosamine:LPS N-acetylglucosamine transferase
MREYKTEKNMNIIRILLKSTMWFLIVEFGCNFILQTISYSFYKNAKKATGISCTPQFIQFNDALTGYGNNLDSENNNKIILFFGGSNYIAYNSVEMCQIAQAIMASGIARSSFRT